MLAAHQGAHAAMLSSNVIAIQSNVEGILRIATHSPEAVPTTYFVDDSTGEAAPIYTLRKRDFQLFMKVLRRRTGQKVRYFAAGEYGDKTFRPHYHAIIFGLHLDDLQLSEFSPLDGPYKYYKSVTLQKCWDVVDSKCKERHNDPYIHKMVAYSKKKSNKVIKLD